MSYFSIISEVPEFTSKTTPKPDFADFIKMVCAGQSNAGADRISPIVLGPVTLCALAKYSDGASAEAMLAKLVPCYVQLLTELSKLAVPEVQMHEPCLVLEEAAQYKSMFATAYTALAKVGVPLNIVTYFDDVDPEVLKWTLALPGLSVLSLDFTRGDNLSSIRSCGGFPAGVTLGAGVVDGRSVWADGDVAAQSLEKIRTVVGDSTRIRIQPSCSLQYLPLDLEAETALPPDVKAKLAFAKQKLALIAALAKGDIAASGSEAVEGVAAAAIAEELFSRTPDFDQRRPQQFSVPGGFVTNTIGSFPQTREIRKLRLRFKKGIIGEDEYNHEVDKHIAYAIGIQEALDLDILVHGEPERSDMVEFFGQHLHGMHFTLNGWVQSYGSRYVRPPIIFGDISRTGPMTVREFKYAQSLTKKPVKGMLTAATTIINWSFPRKDVSREVQAYQIGLALREEVLDLEAAGCKIIQVDDPAIREGLPLKKKDWPSYLHWAVRAFCLSTSGVQASTQIYSHLCYADFGDILPALEAMDVDVLTVENSRSGDEMLRAFSEFGYKRDIGPGLYDIHSPVVPPVDVMSARIKLFLEAGIAPQSTAANPDCGLKTRKWEEVIPSLRNMVAAAKSARAIASGTTNGKH